MSLSTETIGFDLSAPPAGFIDDPYPVYAALRREGRVLEQPDGSRLLTHWQDLDRVYRDTRAFSSDKVAVFGPKYGEGSPLFTHHTTSLVFSDPPLHTRVRKIMVGAMTPRALARMEPRLVVLVDGLLDGLAGRVDLIEDYAAAIPVEVIGNLFDIPRGERGPLRDWSLAILGALEPVLTVEEEARGNAAVRDFSAYLEDLIARRRARPGDPETDVLTRLLAADAGGGLSLVELVQNCIFILNAGHETTTNLIGNALGALAADCAARARLIAEPELIETAVDEFLRFESPNQFGNRLTTAPVEIGGSRIPAGVNLHLCIGAANRDPAQFGDPERLDLARRPNRHLAFAGGPHTCVGLTLARMEGRVAIGRFLQRFPEFGLDGRGARSPRLRFRGYTHLPAWVS
ncbi:MAG: cytochrome P450 [Pseudomonadota bacterium]